MKYIEIIVIINLIIHLAFINISNYILSHKINKLLVILSSILDILYVICYLLIPYKIHNIKYLIIFIISIIPFMKNGLTKALFQSLIYLMLNFLLGGIEEILFRIINNFYSVLLSLLIIEIIFLIYIIYKRKNIKIDKLTYDIIISFKNKKYYLNGYLDTGNFLYSDEQIPIVFLNKKFIKLGRYKTELLVSTATSKSKISIYDVDEFKIKLNKKYVKRDVYIAFSNIGFDAMFGINLMGG